MSAPKTLEGKAAALAKRRKTMRPRPLAELREEVRQVGKHFEYAEGERPDLRELGRIVGLLAHFITDKRGSDALVEELDRIGDAVIAWSSGRLVASPMPWRQIGTFGVDADGLRDLKVAIGARVAATRRKLELDEEQERNKTEATRAHGQGILQSILSVEPEGGTS